MAVEAATTEVLRFFGSCIVCMLHWDRRVVHGGWRRHGRGDRGEVVALLVMVVVAMVVGRLSGHDKALLVWRRGGVAVVVGWWWKVSSTLVVGVVRIGMRVVIHLLLLLLLRLVICIGSLILLPNIGIGSTTHDVWRLALLWLLLLPLSSVASFLVQLLQQILAS